MADEFNTKIPEVRKSKISHLNRQIPPEAHTPMYNWHKFWARKTWNVVAEFIKTYCPEDGVVFDPFAGSGVVALEALKNKRRAIICDILPISTKIIRLTIKPVSLLKLQEAYKRLEKKAKDKILSLYQTNCRSCGKKIPFTCAIWKRNKCIEIRYQKCPFCGDRKEKDNRLDSFDKKILSDIKKKKIKEWYPKQKLYHHDGQPFMKKEKYESIDELFTKRNLQALAWLMKVIEEEKNKDLRDFLKIGFSSMVHLSTKMCPVRPTRPFSSAWTEHSFWYAEEFMEQNVWERFESAIIGRQGLIEGKKESNKYFDGVKFAKNYEEVINGDADVFVYTGSCFDLMEQMDKNYAEKGCVDYIFTDPPYDASIQYGELAYLWVCWLKLDRGYLEQIATDEVIRNPKQHKDFNYYYARLQTSFEKMFNVLKPDTYLTVTFHNPTFKVRNATIRAGVFAGFEFEKIHHQELARPSAKSLLQPFGSAQGDFYIRFHKLEAEERPLKPEEIDEKRFERIVVDTATRVIAERGEETPYTILINTIDPELARHGYFSELDTGLDVKTVLKNHMGKEFILVPTKLGGSEGKLWWFKNPSMVKHLEEVPLSERVEQTVLRKLQQKGKLTFTEVWNAISTEFPNSLTSDSTSIKEALKAYARPVSKGDWLIKPNLRPGELEREHTTIIAILAEIGIKHKYDIWVGKPEQSHEIREVPRPGKLKQFVTLKNLSRLKNVQNTKTVEDIDLVWIRDNKAILVFEIESTTSMTGALLRGSNIEPKVPKFLLLPEERETQFLRKLKSPMFAERFREDNWNVIFFETLLAEYSKHKGKTDVASLVNKKVDKKLRKETGEGQLGFFR